MADIFDFYVYDDRSIQFAIAEPIMLEDKDVTQFRFRIPKSLNGFDMSTWAWWFVYVNALGTKYSVPLTLTDDEDDPDNYSTATFTVNYGMSEKSGKVSFAIEVIDANTGGDILHEWHTKTYTTTVEETLQCNQVEYAEDESDIISALIQQVQALVAQGGLDATGVTSGYVPTADGNDGWSWQAQQGGGGGGVTVDDELSETSENPVQNKVVTENINSLTDQLAQKGTYSKPSGGIPKSDLASAVQTSLGLADTALQSAPVSSVNGKTGAVVLGVNDVNPSATNGQILRYGGSGWGADDFPVSPDAKTSDMTQPVGIDSSGKLWTASGGGGLVLLESITTTESVANLYKTFTPCKRVLLELSRLSQNNTSESSKVLWVTFNNTGYDAKKAISLHQTTGASAGVVYGTQYECRALIDAKIYDTLFACQACGTFGVGNGFTQGDALSVSYFGNTISSVYMYLPSVEMAAGFRLNIWGELA